MTRLFVNGIEREATAAAGTPLLDVLRDDFGLKAARLGARVRDRPITAAAINAAG